MLECGSLDVRISDLCFCINLSDIGSPQSPQFPDPYTRYKHTQRDGHTDGTDEINVRSPVGYGFELSLGVSHPCFRLFDFLGLSGPYFLQV
jgi:hypothetical protein